MLDKEASFCSLEKKISSAMVWAHPQDAVKGNFSPDLLDQIKRKINDIVELSLRANKDLCRIVDCSGRSLLHYAAEFGNHYITQFLVNLSRVKINLQNHDGNTPLFLATKEQYAKTTKVLLDSNADIYICNKTSASAVQIALRTSPINIQIAKLFLQRINHDCSSNTTEIIEILMKIKCPIYTAVLLENIDVTTCMISEGCSIDAIDLKSGKTALHFAVENVDLRHLRKLLFLGADVKVKDVSGRPPLALLSDFSKWDEALSIVKILMNKTSLTSCDKNGFMYMRSILRNGTVDAVYNVLLSLNRFIVTDQHGQNIIHHLASNCRPRIVSLTKHFKNLETIDLNARDNYGLTALHCAVNAGNRRFVKYLVGKGVNLHVLSNDGVSPLLEAVQSTQSRIEQRVECVKILLRNKAQPDIFLGHYFKIHDNDSAIDRDYDLIEPAIAMLALWKVVERHFNEGILKKIQSYDKLKKLFDGCTVELEKMKSEKAYGNMSVLDVLVEYEDDGYSRYSIFFGFSGRWTKRVIEKYRDVPIYYELLDKQVCRAMSTKKEDLRSFVKNCFIGVGLIAGILLFPGFRLF